MTSPSAQFSLTLRVEIDRVLGQLGRVTSAIGAAGGQIGAVDIVEQLEHKTVRELIVDAIDIDHGNAIVAAVNEVPGATVLEIADRTFELHRGGKIYTGMKAPIRNRTTSRWRTRRASLASAWPSTRIPRRRTR